MLNYVCLGTNDIKRAVLFYDATLGALNLMRDDAPNDEEDDGQDWAEWCVYKNNDVKMLTLALCEPFNRLPASAGNGTMLSFRAASWQEVNDFHAAAIANGGKSEGEPGLRLQYDANFYAAYVRDPDGNKLAAVCRGFNAPQN
jgi:catechol 2,3-dioxygenase-like lactoylglutathione lyase family enzyme